MIKLPIIQETNTKERTLSMDEYLEFVHFDWKNTIDREGYRKWKKRLAVNVPFSMK